MRTNRRTNGGQMNESKTDTANRLAGATDVGSASAERPGAATEPSPVGESVRSIAVVGMAPAAVQPLNALSDDVEIWTLNVGPQAFAGDRWHRHYEVHDYDWLKERQGQNVKPYLEWLGQDHGDKPIYLPKLDPRIPNGKQYPLTEVVQKYGRIMPDATGGRPGIYFQSTVDWMVVHAINEFQNDAARENRQVNGRLHVLGVDMGLDLEYKHQRPSIEHWLGVCLGMGIEVVLPETSDLLQCAYPYGLESYEPRAKKLQQRRNELNQQVAQAAQQEAQARDRKMALRGALDDLEYITQGRY